MVKETANFPEEYEKHCFNNKVKIWTFFSYLFLGLGDFFGRALLQIEGKPRITTLRQQISWTWPWRSALEFGQLREVRGVLPAQISPFDFPLLLLLSIQFLNQLVLNRNLLYSVIQALSSLQSSSEADTALNQKTCYKRARVLPGFLQCLCPLGDQLLGGTTRYNQMQLPSC